MNLLIIFAIQAVCAVIATTIHEFSRAVVSTLLGDKKPKNDGRLTINPVKHFEPIGFILMWVTGFGWGKPVETSQLFYKNRKRDVVITAVMPSIINLAVAAVAAFIFSRFSLSFGIGIGGTILTTFLYNIVRMNVSLAVYNIVPVTPMDSIKVLSAVMPANSYFKYIQYEKIIQMLFLLCLFMGYTDVIFSPIISFVLNALF